MTPEQSFADELCALLPRLRRFALGLSRSPSDADDLTQMTVERALRSREQWKPGTRLDSWVYKIMRNMWIDTARSKARRERREAPPDEAATVGNDPRASMDATLDLERAMAGMNLLPEEQREVLVLILIEGFGYREAAELLDLPIGTVSSRLVRGRTALLAIMGERT